MDIVTAGLSVAALFMFRVNLLDARAFTLDYLGWIPGGSARRTS